MIQTLKYASILTVVLFVTACGGGNKNESAALKEKKAALEKLKTEQNTINDKIATLEKEIATLDTSSYKKRYSQVSNDNYFSYTKLCSFYRLTGCRDYTIFLTYLLDFLDLVK